MTLHKTESATGKLDDPEILPEVGGVAATGEDQQFITASKVETGVYRAQFAYNGTANYLYDVWHRSSPTSREVLTTGSGFYVYDDGIESSYTVPSYVINITNLKSSYSPKELATLRVYTRDKNWSPNIYTVAKNQAPVSNIKDLYYKIAKVSNNFVVISYSTGSNPSYSSLSYDKDGSFFDLDMSILEPNNAYEISFMYKDGSKYREQREKFRFRVDP